MRIISKQELKNMNYILGKEENNYEFTKFEDMALTKLDLTNEKVVEIAKYIWENRENEEIIEAVLEQLKVKGGTN